MPKYKVECYMKSPDWKKRTFATAIDKHPDIAKQKILNDFPGHYMEQIKIERVE